MANNYVEFIKSSSSGVTYAIRDAEARALIAGLSEAVGALQESIISSIYPVGSIYMSAVEVAPDLLFGGTWERLKDRFLLGAGDVYSAGEVGGESEVALTENELPIHSHGFLDYWSLGDHETVNENKTVAVNGDGQGLNGANPNDRSKTADTGAGEAHNNMPPYLTVYMWKRVE